MSSVDVGGLHGDQVLHQLVGRLHALLEECDHDSVEFLLEHRVPTEELLAQQLGENAHQFVVDQRDTLGAGFLQSLDLLLDNQFEGGSSDEEGGRRTR